MARASGCWSSGFERSICRAAACSARQPDSVPIICASAAGTPSGRAIAVPPGAQLRRLGRLGHHRGGLRAGGGGGAEGGGAEAAGASGGAGAGGAGRQRGGGGGGAARERVVRLGLGHVERQPRQPGRVLHVGGEPWEVRGRGVREGWRNLRRGTMAALKRGRGCTCVGRRRRLRDGGALEALALPPILEPDLHLARLDRELLGELLPQRERRERVGGEDGLEDPLLLVGGRPPRHGGARAAARTSAPSPPTSRRPWDGAPETQRRRNSRNSLRGLRTDFAGDRKEERLRACPADTEHREPRRRVDQGPGEARRPPNGRARGGRGRCGGREEGGGSALVASQTHATPPPAACGIVV